MLKTMKERIYAHIKQWVSHSVDVRLNEAI